ncbi:MAG: hypothetical protein KC912_24030, partial [Proteobacteria bacterium]|nr:hypothetical protein [Pseudomonadota bacterium]
LLAGLRIARDADDYAWLRPSTSWWPALPVAAAVAAGVASRGLAPVPLRPALAAAQTRLGDALQPELLLPLVAVVIGQELVFRGFLQRAVGPWVALGAFVLTISPLDPLHGIGVGLPLAVLAMHTRSPLPGIAARLLASVALLALPTLAPGLALAGCLLGTLFIGIGLGRLKFS